MRVLSLFDGISGTQQALKNLGINPEVYFASEIDKHAIKVCLNNFPNTIQLGDVTKLHGFDFGKIDLMTWGSPCQDLSIAKKDRKGLDGQRSGLFWDAVKLWQRIKPKYWIMENVASMSKQAMHEISRTLGTYPIMIDSALVSAQQRKRLYWTNIKSNETLDGSVPQPKDEGILLKDVIESGDVDRFKSVCIDANYYKGGSLKNYLEKNRRQVVLAQSENRLCVTEGTKRIGDLGSDCQGNRVYSMDGKSVSLNAMGGGRGAKTGLYLQNNIPIDKENNEQLKSKTLRTSGQGSGFDDKHNWDEIKIINPCALRTHPRIPNQDFIVRKLTPLECERLQTYPDEYTGGGIISNTHRYKCLGNSFTVKVIEHILSYALKGDI